MPVTPAQRTAIEQVIDAVKCVPSPRKKRVLAELFLELVDKDAWADYYQVSTFPVPLNPHANHQIPGYSSTQGFERHLRQASGGLVQRPSGSL